MLSPLLIQLFGREVVDRLEQAGLTTDDAVARLGAEELSTRTGVSPEVARRIIALAVELCAPNRARPGSRGAARPRSRKPRARAKKSKRNRPTPDDPIASSERAAAAFGAAEPLAPEESTETPTLQQSGQESDAFVDEPGLIAWMGFAARAGPEGSLLSSVADGILDAESPREPNPPSPSTAPRAVTLEGSFWSFGSRPHPGLTVSPAPYDPSRRESPGDESGRSGSLSARPVPFHRRRSHDGH